MKSENVVKWMIGICFLSLCITSLTNRKPLEIGAMDQKYNVKIIDDHEVHFTSKKDTIIILFQNAYNLSGEESVTIKK